MIYQDAKQTEERLQNAYDLVTNEGIPDGDDNWVCGYTTAIDVATCVNNTTIWHKVDEDQPDDDRDVLVALIDDSMKVMWYGSKSGTWYWGDDAVDDQDNIVAWCELPDVPRDW